MVIEKIANRLAKETSPYLLQHAHNPVDWWPWCDEAFSLAQKLDKPIFLSVGYSTCHWCHVMERESFEDEEVAKLLNETFVCIKVDREERPDIDSVYMKFCQAMTGSGGWPLTIIMNPDKKPFFASTYIPKQTMYGRVGMVDFIPKIKEAWLNEREDVISSSNYLVNALNKEMQRTSGNGSSKLDKNLLEKAFVQLEKRFDDKNGGFSHAPKFPTTHNIIFLIRYWKMSGNPKALEMAEKTLEKMRLGGIYDHIGGGFHRYSTDPIWRLPHFEKMLYDQALIALAYIEAYEATGKGFYKKVVEEIFEYVIRDMSSEKGFYSAEDADSEGKEGKFYLWTEEEIKKILGKDADEFCKMFNVEDKGNFREEATGEITCENILFLNEYIENKFVDMCKKMLFSERSKRIRPHKDTKILTDWNALMTAAFAKAGRVFDNKDYVKIAEKHSQLIFGRFDSQLLHTEKIDGFLDDYAFSIWAFIELYQSTFDNKYVEMAEKLNGVLISKFLDRGAFAISSEKLLIDNKDLYDGALPSGNSVMVSNLFLLSKITGHMDFEKKCLEILESFSSSLNSIPSAYTYAICGLMFFENDFCEIILSKEDENVLKELRKKYVPNKIILLKGVNEFTNNMDDINGKTGIYLCQKGKCNIPTDDTKNILRQFH